MDTAQDYLALTLDDQMDMDESDVDNLAVVSAPKFSEPCDTELARLQARLSGYRLAHVSSSTNEANSSISDAAKTAWRAHLAELKPLEARMFIEHSKGDLNRYLQQIEAICQSHGDASKGRKIAQLFRPWFKTINQYVPTAQTIIQADPSSSALILGGVTCIMSISECYLEFQEKIAELLADMGEQIDMLMEYGSDVYRNNTSIQCAIVEIFADVLKFCTMALPLFRDKYGNPRSSAHSFLKALKTSFQGHFGPIVDKYKKGLQTFRRRAELYDRKEDRAYRSMQAEVSSYLLAQTNQLHTEYSSARHTLDLEFAAPKQLAIAHTNQKMPLQGTYYELEINNAGEPTSASRSKQSDNPTESFRARILAWLSESSIKFHTDQDKNAFNRLAGTGMWLMQHETYLAWKSKPISDLLWITGKRGCGKSFLTSVVVQDLRFLCESDDNLAKDVCEKSAYAYIYCTSLQMDKCDPTRLLCSLVEQLSYQLPGSNVDPYLARMFQRHQGSRPLDFDESTQALESLLGTFGVTYLVVDGLDELRSLEDERFEKQCQYFRKITKLLKDDHIVNLVAFSRPEYAAISDAFQGCSQLVMDYGANNGDMEEFITMKLSKVRILGRQNEDLLRNIKHELTTRAEGMFLWADLVINDLNSERTIKGLRQEVKNVPRGLDHQYTTSLRKIIQNETYRGIALKILLWIANAKRSLQRAELLEALAIEPGMTELDEEDKLLDDDYFCGACENLIMLDRNTGTYQLLHSSLKDYLTDNNSLRSDIPLEYYKLQQGADYILGMTCMTYLLFERFRNGPASNLEEYEQLKKASPFIQYAAVYWGRHIATATGNDIQDLARTLISSSHTRNLSREEEPQSLPFTGPSHSTHIIAIFDLVEIGDTMDDFDLSLTQMDGLSTTTLDHALLHGSRQMCTRLLWGPEGEKSYSSAEAYKYSPLLSAAAHGWDEVVGRLLSLGCDPEVRDVVSQSTALHVAVRQGSTSVVDLLIEHGVNINAIDSNGRTPLALACSEHDLNIAKKLINAGADVKLCGLDGYTALHIAARKAELLLAQTLLQHGAIIDAVSTKTFKLRAALHLAAREDAVEVLQLLIDEGADIELRDIDESILHLSLLRVRARLLP